MYPQSQFKNASSFFRLIFVTIFAICMTIPLFAIDSLQVHWATYVGGSAGIDQGGLTWRMADIVSKMVMDNHGNFYITGHTKTTNLPGRTNAHTTGSDCAFVTKLDKAGTVLWTTYLGGAKGAGPGSYGIGLCIDGGGTNVFITGSTSTNDAFPQLLNSTWQGGGAFVASLRASDGHIQWSRLLTTKSTGQGNAICLHSGYLYVTGAIGGGGEMQNSINSASGGGDAFLYKLTTGGGVVRSCFFGGSWGQEGANDIFIDDQDHIFLGGDIFWEYPNQHDYDYDLPKEKNEWRGDQRDGFVCRYNTSLDLQWSRYIGGKAHDVVHHLTGDDGENLWIAGRTYSNDLEGKIIEPYRNEGSDGYLTKINKSGNTVDWVSYAHQWGGAVFRPKLTTCRKIVTISNYDPNDFGLQVFDADLGYHEWFIEDRGFLNCTHNVFKDFAIDKNMNIYICGDAPYANISFPNRTNEHSGKGYDGFVVKMKPKGHFFHFEDGLPPSWSAFTPECWNVSHGQYVFTGKGGDKSRNAYFSTQTFCNFSYEVQVKKSSGRLGSSYGLNIRKDPITGDRYRFGITSDGYYSIIRKINGIWEIIVDYTSSNVVKQGFDVCNSLRVTAKDSVLNFYINGRQIYSEKQTPILCGLLGLYVFDSADATNIVKFDNVYIGSYTLTPTKITENKNTKIPTAYKLGQNYPNPFNPATTIEFSIPEPTRVRIEIINMLGETVASLLDGNKAAGHYSVRWNGKTNAGKNCPSGLYFCVMKTPERALSQKVMLMR